MGVPGPRAVDGTAVAELAGWLAEQRDPMTADLAAYVGHETPSNDKALLDAGLDWITGWLGARLTAPAGLTRTGGGTHGDVVVVDLPPSDGVAGPPLLWLCHYDTVWDAGTLAGWPFECDGTVATGPGAFDMKGGLVQGVWALRALERLGLPRPGVRILLNGDEELGSPVSRSLIERSAEDVAAVLVLEPSADAAVKTMRKGVGIFELDVTGVEAHAGLDPTKGASAIDELARLILQVREFADLAAGTSVNVGTAHGGRRTNVIAGHAHAMIDVRVGSTAEADRVRAAFASLRPSESRLTVTVGGGWNRPVMERTPAIGEMYDLAKGVAAAVGFDLAETSAGGGSDGNFVACRGVPVLDGPGPVGAGAHSRGEWVDVTAMPARAALVAGIMHTFAGGRP
jgi:glutamate carboxypeptidase